MAKIKSIDPAALEMLEVAQEAGIETAFERAERIKQCPIGEDDEDILQDLLHGTLPPGG